MRQTVYSRPFHRHPLAAAILGCFSVLPLGTQAQQAGAVQQMGEIKVLGTAEEENLQALGSSVISAEDLKRRPPANDLSEVIRTQPGVNLSGNSSSGQYGNNRQIDLRGMGPENTLILIDGKPASSRDGVAMGRSGERDTRGDANWVPVDAIERVEVLRGPAAARYGSGAAGGVVNIITKRPADTLSGSVSAYVDRPHHSEEQDTRRLGFNLSGPLADRLSFRLYGNVARTSADDPSLNAAASGVALSADTIPPAGREGVRNRDINGLLRWDLTDQQTLELESGFSRQGNIYAGERRQSGTGSAVMRALAGTGAETNATYRRTTSLTHRGKWDIGTSKTYVQVEDINRSSAPIGLAGAQEGSLLNNNRVTSHLRNVNVHTELNTPVTLAGMSQVLTYGLEARRQNLDDPFSTSQSPTNPRGSVPGLPANRSGKAESTLVAAYVEDNLEVTPELILTPGVRFDHHDQFGNNWSPSLNASFQLSPEVSVKGGVARAFKAPNLYQSNPNYLYFSMGAGCPVDYPSLGGGCYIQGSEDLKAETSINKEIGLAFDNQQGLTASLTWFRNDYKNKIHADMYNQGAPLVSGASQIFRWANAANAVVQGFEGSVNLPLLGGGKDDRLKWYNNFTYMSKNRNTTTGQPLSVVPKYTVNSSLDWQATDQLSLQLNATFYGKQVPRTLTARGEAETGNALNTRGAYHLIGIGGGYDLNRNLRLGFGIKNIADKRLFREATMNGRGAATYNEPGRTYYLSATASF